MLKSWKLKEIVLMSLFAVVFGIVYLLFLHVGNIWAGFIGPIAYEWILEFGLSCQLFVCILSASLVLPLFRKLLPQQLRCY